MENTLPVFFLEGHFLNGAGDIGKSLPSFIRETLRLPSPFRDAPPQTDLIARFKGFQPFAIASAGLVDGINPCAFTVIVFFISFLTLQGYKKRDMMVIGLSYIFAVFVTYLLLGLGLFEFLYRMSGFWVVVRVFNLTVGTASIVFGIMCVYDFVSLRKGATTEGLLLQLPAAVKKQINKVIGLQYRIDKKEAPHSAGRGHGVTLFITAITTGVLVSLLEAICTGQVYLPTIAFVLKTSHLQVQAFAYLILYNVMFIVPLLIIFLCALGGMNSAQFGSFFKKNLTAVKLIMAGLFFSLGLLLLWRF